MPRYVYYFAGKEISFWAASQKDADEKLATETTLEVAGDEGGSVVSKEYGTLLCSEVIFGGQKD